MTLIEHQQTVTFLLALGVVFGAIALITWAAYRIVRVCKGL